MFNVYADNCFKKNKKKMICN